MIPITYLSLGGQGDRGEPKNTCDFYWAHSIHRVENRLTRTADWDGTEDWLIRMYCAEINLKSFEHIL